MPQSIAPPKRGWRRIVLIGALLGAAGVSLSVAEDLYVSKPVARILSDKTGFSDTVAEARKGDKLTVVAREDKWVLVRYGEKQGYVLADSLAAEKPGGSLADIFGGGGTSGMSTGAAASGLLPSAEQVAQGKNLSTEGLKRLEAGRKRLNAARIKAFAAEGGVGPAKPKATGGGQ